MSALACASVVELAPARLVHYSRHPLGRLRKVALRVQEVGHKPQGLWLSVEQPGGFGWREWCDAESFHLDCFVISTELEMKIDVNVLWLSDESDIDSFHEQYRNGGGDFSRDWIDWRLVARDFDGIFIAPYCWERRLTKPASSWYYGWDCACGCVWQPRCLTLAAPPVEAAAEEKG